MTRARLGATLVTALGVVGGLSAFGAYQRHVGAAAAKREAVIAHDRTLADSAASWQVQLAAALAQVQVDTVRAVVHAKRGASLHVKREALPAPADTANSSDSVAYWRGRAILAEGEATEYHNAYQAQREATARLSSLVNRTAVHLDSSTAGLNRSLNRETRRGFRFPKLLTAAAGCALGAYVAKDDLVGCLGGATVLTVALPTR